MRFSTSSPAPLFSVVGSAFVAGGHGEPGHLSMPSKAPDEQVQSGVAGLWVALFAAMLFSAAGGDQVAARAFH